MKKGKFRVSTVQILIVVILIILFIFLGFQGDDTGMVYTEIDQRFLGTWVNETALDEYETFFPIFTFYSNGTGLTNKGQFWWFVVTDNVTEEKQLRIVFDSNHERINRAINFYFSGNNNNTVTFISSVMVDDVFSGYLTTIYKKQ